MHIEWLMGRCSEANPRYRFSPQNLKNCDNCHEVQASDSARCMLNKPLSPDQTPSQQEELWCIPEWDVRPLAVLAGWEEDNAVWKTELRQKCCIKYLFLWPWIDPDSGPNSLENQLYSSCINACLKVTDTGSLSGVDESYPTVIGWVPDYLCVFCPSLCASLYTCV